MTDFLFYLKDAIFLPYLWPIAGLLVPLLLGVAWLTWTERKVIAAVQLRKGPNVVGLFGLLQPIADGLKLFLKEQIVPTTANKVLFFAAPIMTYLLALLLWAVIPFGSFAPLADLNIGLLYILALSSLGVYGIFLAGWASNSRYAFLGGVRAVAQMISYELVLSLSLLPIVMTAGTLNLTQIVEVQTGLWFFLPHFPMFLIFFIAGLAETNRAPFDIPEAESELVGGYHVEYSGLPFAFFFLGEYANMILIATLTTLLFLGGWHPVAEMGGAPILWLMGKAFLCLLAFIFIRAAFPRYRFDQLMRLGWKYLLPVTLFWLLGTAFVLLYRSGGGV